MRPDGDAFPEFCTVGVQSHRNHVPGPVLDYTCVEAGKGLARDQAHFQRPDDALRVGRVHRLHMAGIQFGQAFDQGRKAFLSVLIVQLRPQGQVGRQRVQTLQRGFDVHARASSQDGGAVV